MTKELKLPIKYYKALLTNAPPGGKGARFFLCPPGDIDEIDDVEDLKEALGVDALKTNLGVIYNYKLHCIKHILTDFHSPNALCMIGCYHPPS